MCPQKDYLGETMENCMPKGLFKAMGIVVESNAEVLVASR